MFTPELRRRLSEIARGKSAPAPPLPEIPTGKEHTAAWFDVSGREERGDLGAFLVCERRMSDLVSDAGAMAGRVSSLVGAAGHDPSRLLFVDLETCGLTSVPLFLVGTMRLMGDDFEICQLFARDYSEERSVLGRVRELTVEAGGFVTFNGKSFDIPYLRDRMAFHRLEFVPPRVHLDLLHAARRKWKGRLPDCRLTTLETFICQRYRSGDVEGSEIPGLYHDFVRTGNFAPLVPVFRHNVMDLMTMAELLPEVL